MVLKLSSTESERVYNNIVKGPKLSPALFFVK